MIKPFAAFDVDGTIFKFSLAEKVVDSCIQEGIFKAESFNEVYANKRRWQFNNSEGIYQAYLDRLIGTLLTQIVGVDIQHFDQVVKSMVDEHRVRRFAFPRKLINAVQRSHYIIAISGSPDFLVRPFLKDLPIQEIYGSTYEIDEGKFTGIAKSVGDKSTILKSLVSNSIVSQKGSFAIGDTFSDKSMFIYSGKAIMFNASRTLTDYGKQFGWLRVNEVKDQITVLEYSEQEGHYIEQEVDTVIDKLKVI